jgi:hypothetical protein
MRSSDVDTGFPVSGTDTILGYLQGQDKYIEVQYSSLLPGDILMSDNGRERDDETNPYSGHTMIYTGTVTGSDGKQYVAAEASLDQKVPGLTTNSSVLWMQGRTHYSAWRLNG